MSTRKLETGSPVVVRLWCEYDSNGYYLLRSQYLYELLVLSLCTVFIICVQFLNEHVVVL